MGTSIQRYEEPLDGLTQWRPPETVLAEAKQAADALTRVISLKKDPVKFNGEVYLEFEDWQTCAKFYGVTAKVEKTAFVQYGNVSGFEATAVAIDRNGMEISRAESLCLNDEANWGMVPQYEWKDELDANGKKIWVEGRDGKKRPKGERVQVGEVAKPLFQLKSMAQTRACSKVLRQVFAWIVVLAGYKPTPAEEMTGNEQFEDHEDRGKKPPVQQPSRASEKKQETQAQTGQQAAQTQQAATNTGEKEISGIIESAKQAKSGTLWITVKGEPLVVAVDEKNMDGDMVAGNFIKFRAVIKWTDKLKTEKNPKGEFWSCAALIELSPVQEGEVTKVEEKTLAPDAEAVANDLFGKEESAGKAAVQEMVQNGTLKPASALPEGTAKKPGTIGLKRAQRVWALINQNKANNHGFNEAELKKILTALPVPIEHLRDLEMGLYEQVEKWATGEDDFNDFWKD